ncbi:MAG: hypothetical protein U0174_11400 [Polyangiaceae bacterium]
MSLEPETQDPQPEKTRPRDVVLVVLYFLLAFLPLLGHLKKLPDANVVGAFEPVYVKPIHPLWDLRFWANAKNLVSLKDAFQPSFTKWFEWNLWPRGVFVRADNAVLYHAFGETKPDSHVKLAKDNVLINGEDTMHFSSLDFPSAETLDVVAERIARMQKRLKGRGAAFVPVIIPSKTTIYPDAVLPKWRTAVPTPRPSDVAYANFSSSLRAHGVDFVDARALLLARPEPPSYIYARGGRHWTYLASCLATQEVMKSYARLTGAAVPPYPCDYDVIHDMSVNHEDYDLYRLMNVWGAPVDHSGTPVLKWVDGEPEKKIDLLIIGTSFCWNFFKDSNDRTHVFGRQHFFYYDKVLYDWPVTHEGTVSPGTPEWKEAAFGKQLYLLDLFESYPLTRYVLKFLAEMEAALTMEP